jgi:hypothetical protein
LNRAGQLCAALLEHLPRRSRPSLPWPRNTPRSV